MAIVSQGFFSYQFCVRQAHDSKISPGKALEVDNKFDYFKSEEDEIIFYILEVDGKKRSDKLGINRKCFMDKEEARKWENNILKKIHPDKIKNKYATDAVAEINQLYKEMVGND